MPEKKIDAKTLVRMLPDLLKLGVITEEFAAKLREADAKGLLPKTQDPLREKIKTWMYLSGWLPLLVSTNLPSGVFTV